MSTSLGNACAAARAVGSLTGTGLSGVQAALAGDDAKAAVGDLFVAAQTIEEKLGSLATRLVQHGVGYDDLALASVRSFIVGIGSQGMQNGHLLTIALKLLRAHYEENQHAAAERYGCPSFEEAMRARKHAKSAFRTQYNRLRKVWPGGVYQERKRLAREEEEKQAGKAGRKKGRAALLAETDEDDSDDEWQEEVHREYMGGGGPTPREQPRVTPAAQTQAQSYASKDRKYPSTQDGLQAALSERDELQSQVTACEAQLASLREALARAEARVAAAAAAAQGRQPVATGSSPALQSSLDTAASAASLPPATHPSHASTSAGTGSTLEEVIEIDMEEEEDL